MTDINYYQRTVNMTKACTGEEIKSALQKLADQGDLSVDLIYAQVPGRPPTYVMGLESESPSMNVAVLTGTQLNQFELRIGDVYHDLAVGRFAWEKTGKSMMQRGNLNVDLVRRDVDKIAEELEKLL
jgi:hypothetical protein